MTYPASFSRPVTLRARRDTILLVASATAMTFAMSYVIHQHRGPDQSAAGLHRAWTGDLADVPPPAALAVSTEPLTSASLVVPQSELALPPQPPMRALVKLRGCGEQSCTSKASGVPTPTRRPVQESVVARSGVTSSGVTSNERRAVTYRVKPTLMSRLNPLNHLPDVAQIKRPFAYAGDAVTGWFKRF